MLKTAIACASGSFKGVYVHGVLKAFEENGFYVDAYAAASSSSIPAAFASAKALGKLDYHNYWQKIYDDFQTNDFDIAKAILNQIDELMPLLQQELSKQSAELLIGLSEVINEEAAIQTQGEDARMLGKQLLLATRNKDNSWAKENLQKLFASTSPTADILITEHNLRDILYATTRMLHAWKYPAMVERRPMIDASYTCSCAALEMNERGFEKIIAIAPETGSIAHDFFNSFYINDQIGDKNIHLIQPPFNLKTIGVDYLKVSSDGFKNAFQIGIEDGLSFLKNHK